MHVRMHVHRFTWCSLQRTLPAHPAVNGGQRTSEPAGAGEKINEVSTERITEFIMSGGEPLNVRNVSKMSFGDTSVCVFGGWVCVMGYVVMWVCGMALLSRRCSWVGCMAVYIIDVLSDHVQVHGAHA